MTRRAASVPGLARAFIAVVPPPAVLDAMEVLLAPVRSEESAVRWAPRDQWHVTLQFLGRVGDPSVVVESLVESLQACPRVAGLRVGGAGGFPRPARATVVWLGLDDPGGGLDRVADAVGSATTRVGFVGESRPFHAHLTVARASRPVDVGRLVDALDVPVGGPDWDVTDVVLLASDTRPDGAVYTEYARCGLGGECLRDRIPVTPEA